MPRAKKVKTVETPETTEAVKAEEVVVAEESPAKKEFRAFIEGYARSNPVKYELKKEELFKKLNQL